MSGPRAPSPEATQTTHTFGRFLRFWRELHGLSQEQLAERINSSARHIRRLETGAGQPSAGMVEDIANTLQLGARDRNHLRIAAGFHVQQAPVDFRSPSLRWLRNAMRLTLKAQNPYPGLLMDRAGDILMVNRAWVNFHRQLLSAEALDQVTNLFSFLFSHSQLIKDSGADTMALILMALKQNALFSNAPEDIAAFEHYLQSPAAPADWQRRAAALEPMASYRLHLPFNGKSQRFYSVSQTVGALGPAAFLAEPRLTLTTLYPEDTSLDLTALMAEPHDHPLLVD